MIVGTGIDVIEIARMERALARRGERFARRVFAPAEIAVCEAQRRAPDHFAVRFAAKEALMKAIGTGLGSGVRLLDIETVPAAPAQPGRLGLELRGRVAELAARCAEGRAAPEARLAVSWSRTHAMAVVLLESPRS